MSNPFIYGSPVLPNQFVGRADELQDIVDRLVPYGQSVAIVGEPHSGKTSLLDYLCAPQARQRLFGSAGEHLIFSFLDSHSLPAACNQAQFWELALRPLHAQLVAPAPGSPLAQAYQVCQQNAFGTFTLESLLAHLNDSDWRLILLLDEFDVMLYHTTLNCAEFFGGLRTLASRSRGALALTTASRQSLENLNKDTQHFSRAGSPYFNFLAEITLGTLEYKDVADLLDRAGQRFDAEDRRFAASVAGGQPYLLQVTASSLWRLHEKGEGDGSQRRRRAGVATLDQAAATFRNIWEIWPPMQRMALMAVALPEALAGVPQPAFDVQSLQRSLRDLGPELKALRKRGFVVEDAQTLSGWHVGPQIFMWWLTDEIKQITRDEPTLQDWLRRQEWDGLITRGEKEWLIKALRTAGELLKDGAKALIEAAAKATGERIGKGA